MFSWISGFTPAIPTTGQAAPISTTGRHQTWGTLGAIDESPFPHAVTIDRLRIVLSTAPSSTNSIQLTLLKNGVAQSLTATVSGTNTKAQDLTHSVSFNQGDTIAIQATVTGTPTASQVYWTVRQSATNLFGLVGSQTATGSGACGPQGDFGGTLTTGDAGLIVPCAGTFKNFFVNTASSATQTVTVFKNGSSTSLLVALSAATSGSDTTHSFTVAAGDRVALSNSVTSGVAFEWGLSFSPTTDGQSFMGFVDNNHNASTSATQFWQMLADGDGGGNTTETNVQLTLQASTVTTIYGQTLTSPGVSPKAYTFAFRQNAASPGLSVSVLAASPAGNDGNGNENSATGSITIADDDLVDISIAPTSTPTGVNVFGSILIVQPAVVATALGSTLTLMGVG